MELRLRAMRLIWQATSQSRVGSFSCGHGRGAAPGQLGGGPSKEHFQVEGGTFHHALLDLLGSALGYDGQCMTSESILILGSDSGPQTFKKKNTSILSN